MMTSSTTTAAPLRSARFETISGARNGGAIATNDFPGAARRVNSTARKVARVSELP